VSIIEFLSSFDHPLIYFLMRFASLLGDRAFYVILFPVIFWFWRRDDAIRLTALLCISIFMNFWLKDFFQIPRPEGMAEVEADSFAFPSGHAQHAIVLWGFLALNSRKLYGQTIGLIILIGLSRLYFAVHWPIDVVGGWLIGGAILTGFLWSEPRLKPFWIAQARQLRFSLFFIFTALISLFSTIPYVGIVMGALFGLTTGGSVAGSLRLPSTGISPARGGTMVILGSTGLYLIYLAVEPIRHSGEGVLFLALTVIGLWIALGVPWLTDRMLESTGLERRSA
tara:strand:- start:730 stop:1575 length:846 start_codon:yes stop_codon:yes gene_type:complete